MYFTQIYGIFLDRRNVLCVVVVALYFLDREYILIRFIVFLVPLLSSSSIVMGQVILSINWEFLKLLNESERL